MKLEQIFLHSKEGKASIEGILILDIERCLLEKTGGQILAMEKCL